MAAIPTANQVINQTTPQDRISSTVINDTPQAQLYQKYSIVSNEKRTQGIAACPVATDGLVAGEAVVSLIQVHAPFALMVKNWEVSKQSNPPALPTPIEETQMGDVLLSTDIHCGLPSADMNQDRMTYSAQGQYIYVSQVPRMPGTDPLPVGKYPFQLPRVVSNLIGTTGAAFGVGIAAAFGAGYADSITQSQLFSSDYYYLDTVFAQAFFGEDLLDT